ncbi:MAG: hypothetical protein OIF50_11370 [Flavobacteriaceae bacterium]|nr:hypothetical protein [Flavobacteriaceae bacterium]
MGSSSFITNLEGEVVQHLEYVPFGEVFIESKNARWNTPYKFNAKELDEETGLYYYGARYYNPKVSLWLSIDPLWEEVGAHRSPYEYTYSNPIMFIDPTGMGPETKFKNRLTNETVEVRDGIEKTIVVNDSDFQKAKFFANEINPNPGEYGFLFTGVNKDIAQAYNDFYDNVKYYDGYSLSNLYHYLFVKPKLLISNPDPLSGSGGVEFIGGAGKPLIKNGGRYLAKSLGKHLSIQKHHIIPQAVFKKYKTMLEPFMKIGGGFNLKKLPTPFHGNHPKYNEYVGKLISQLGAKNNINAKTLRELQARLNKEINKAYDSGMKLNEYFRILNNNL